MTGVALVPVFLVACVLLAVSGFSKLSSPASARASLQLIGVQVPLAVVRALGAGEVALGVCAAIRPGPLTAGLVAGAYGVFLVTTLRLLAVEGGADCGCFGTASAVASRSHAVLNFVACASAAVAAAFPPPGVTWIVSRPPLVAVTLVVGTATAAFAAYGVFTLFAPAWRAYSSRSA
ncbi:MAG: MauE/DoxX family redox-associated membrane protein [Solirubrobacteraceae bacterium]